MGLGRERRPTLEGPAPSDDASAPFSSRWPGRFTLLSAPRVQRRATGAQIGKHSRVALELLTGRSGTPLPPGLRRDLERRLGHDLSRVRVHSHDAAAAAARALGAEAFTVGQEIYFGAGAFRPGTPSGDRLLTHEVVHTIQQRDVTPGRELEVSSPDDAAEREAEALADEVAAPAAREPASSDADPAPHAADEPSGLFGPHDYPLIAPASHAQILRTTPGDLLNPDPPVMLDIDDMQLFPGGQLTPKIWPIIPRKFVPLARGLIVVDGVPITYHAEADGGALAMANGSYSPGMARNIYVQLDDTDKEAWVAGGPAAHALLQRGYFPFDHSAHARLTADASATFNVSANAGVTMGAAVFGIFSVEAFAGMNAFATVTGKAKFSADLAASICMGKLKVTAPRTEVSVAANLKFGTGAYLGIDLGLKAPDLGWISDATHALQNVPIVNHFVPDLTRPIWSKRFMQTYKGPEGELAWERKFVLESASGESPNVAADFNLGDSLGYDAEQLMFLIGLGDKQTPIPDADPGPSEKEKEGPGAGEVGAARAHASAEITVARGALTIEQEWVTRERAELATRARPVLNAGVGPPGADPAASADAQAIAEYESELDSYEQELAEAGGSLDELSGVASSAGSSASAEDGSTRALAKKALDAVGSSADELGNELEHSSTGGHYDRPTLETTADPAHPGKTDAEMAAARAAADEAGAAHHDAEARILTEKNEIHPIIENCGGNADLISYAGELGHREEQLDNFLARLHTQQAALADKRATLDSNETACDAAEFGPIQAEIDSVRDEFAALGPHPEPPWDTTYAELRPGGIIMLVNPRNIRTRFYGTHEDYNTDVRAMIGHLRRRQVDYRDPAGNSYLRTQWEWTGPDALLSPIREGQTGPARGGDSWWWLEYHDNAPTDGSGRRREDESNESPTIAHDSPKMADQWNARGHNQTRAERQAFQHIGILSLEFHVDKLSRPLL